MMKSNFGWLLALSLVGCAGANHGDKPNTLGQTRNAQVADREAAADEDACDDGCEASDDEVAVESSSECEFHDDGSWKCWGNGGEPELPCAEDAFEDDAETAVEGDLAESDDVAVAEASDDEVAETSDDCVEDADGSWECDDEATPSFESSCEVNDDGSWLCEGRGFSSECGASHESDEPEASDLVAASDA